MGKVTGISWCDHSFNHLWGCDEVNEDCDNCYAKTLAIRFGYEVWGKPLESNRRIFGEKHWAEPLRWNRQAEKAGVRERVFCASMADVFEKHPQADPEREKLWALIEQTPWLDWQLLTKRPPNIAKMVPQRWYGKEFPQNVWLGTSAGTQKTANAMVPALIRSAGKVSGCVPVLFVSVEPQTGPVDLTPWLPMLSWIIVGGESGPKHRPYDPGWGISMRDQCDRWGVAFWFKQHGGLKPTSGGHLLEGQEYHTFPRV